ncbi:MAG: 4-amino-4-deoxy-L-arabinose transferase-like glycosyltransferase [Arenicella sp.]|jgi:hypothetical protein
MNLSKDIIFIAFALLMTVFACNLLHQTVAGMNPALVISGHIVFYIYLAISVYVIVKEKNRKSKILQSVSILASLAMVYLYIAIQNTGF